MLTLRTLKELIDTPKRGEKLPTPKQLRTGESPVVAHKTTGAGVNEVHIIVYQSGYAVYGIGNRATVFPVNLELGYGYSSVTERRERRWEKRLKQERKQKIRQSRITGDIKLLSATGISHLTEKCSYITEAFRDISSSETA